MNTIPHREISTAQPSVDSCRHTHTIVADANEAAVAAAAAAKANPQDIVVVVAGRVSGKAGGRRPGY